MPFTERKEIKSLSSFGGNLYALLKSINISNILFEESGAESGRAYIIFIEKDRRLYPFIYFYLLSNEGRFFAFDTESIEIKRFEPVKREAVDFVESMGFIIEEVDLLSLSPQEMREIIKTLPFYYDDLNKFKEFMEEMEKEGAVEVGDVEVIDTDVEVEAEKEEIEVEIEETPAKESEDEERRNIIKSLIEKYGLGKIKEMEKQKTVFSFKKGNLRYLLGKLLSSG